MAPPAPWCDDSWWVDRLQATLEDSRGRSLSLHIPNTKDRETLLWSSHGKQICPLHHWHPRTFQSRVLTHPWKQTRGRVRDRLTQAQDRVSLVTLSSWKTSVTPLKLYPSLPIQLIATYSLNQNHATCPPMAFTCHSFADAAVPPYPWSFLSIAILSGVLFLWFQLPTINHSLKISNKTFQKEVTLMFLIVYLSK